MKNRIFKSTGLGLLLGVSLVSFANANGAPVEAPKGISITAPELKISGKATGTFHSFRNARNARGDAGFGTMFALEDSSLDFQATGRMDVWDRSFYDWKIRISGDTNATNHVIENRLRLKNSAGTLLFGVHQGVENFMARGAYNIQGATGGFDGNFKTTLTRPTGLYLSTDMVGATSYTTGLTYVTPRFYGFQAGVTYKPNSEHRGEGSNGKPRNLRSSKSTPEAFDLNSVAVGLNYINKFDCGLNVELSGTAVFGKTKPPITPVTTGTSQAADIARVFSTVDRSNTASYAVGCEFSYKNFDLGAEWIDNGRSRQVKGGVAPLLAAAGYTGAVGEFNAGKAFSIATGYTFGANNISYGYYHSERRFNGSLVTGKVHAITANRKIVNGFEIFGEATYSDLESGANAVALQEAMKPGSGQLSNKGAHSILTGAKMKF